MSTTHEAGWAHAPGALRGPAWLRRPADPNALVPHLWSSTAHKNADGELIVGGLAVPELVAEVNTPAYVLDEADFRARARAFRDGFADYDVFYAGKAFLCTTVAQWIAEEGLNLDVCSSGELTVALRAGFDPARIGYHGNNKTHAELRRAVAEGVGRIVARLVRRDRAAGADHRRAGGRSPPQPVMVRVTAGRRGAHPRVHRHRARGPEVRALDHLRRRLGGRTPRAGRPGPRPARAPLAHRQPDLRLLRVRGRRPPGAGAARPDRRRARRDDARARPRRRVRHRLHDPGRPERPRAAGHGDHQDRRARVQGAGDRAAAAVGRAGPGDRRPVDVHGLHRRHGQAGRARRRRGPHLRLGRRRDERQHPDRALRRRLLVHDRQPRVDRRAGPVARRGQALRGRRHRRARRVPARRPGSGRPGRGAGHRRVLPLDGLQLQPRPAAAGGRRAGRGRAGAAAARD